MESLAMRWATIEPGNQLFGLQIIDFSHNSYKFSLRHEKVLKK